MKRIEKNKKEISIVAFFAVLLISIAVYILTPYAEIQATAVCIAIISIYFAVALYIGGIAGIFRAMFNAASYFLAIIGSTYIANLAGGYFEPYLLQTISVITVFLIYHTFRIPHELENEMIQVVYKKDIENAKKETNNVTNYTNYEVAQNIKSYTSKRYSFVNCDLEAKLLRVVGAVGFFLLGILNMLDSMYFAGVISFIYAACIIWYGFIRALIIPIIAYVYVAFIEKIQPYYMMEAKNYLTFHLTLSGIIGAVIYVFCKIILHIYKKDKEYINIQTYKKESTARSCDIFLKSVAPIRLYSKMLEFRIRIETTSSSINVNEAAKLNKISNAAYRQAVENEFIIAGTNLDIDKNVLSIYIYSKEDEVEEVKEIMETLCYNFGRKVELYSYIDDPNWDMYFNSIFPDTYITQELYNENYIAMLDRLKIKTENEHRLLYYFFFKDKKNIANFIKKIKEKNFAIESVDDISGYKNKILVDKDYPYGVVLSNNTKLGLERINMTTKELIDCAKEESGLFDGWALDDLVTTIKAENK
ncbi:MAG: DUF695 domain-containing protein [Clostridia bacterium]